MATSRARSERAGQSGSSDGAGLVVRMGVFTAATSAAGLTRPEYGCPFSGVLMVAGLHPVRGLGEVVLHPVLAAGPNATGPTPARTLALAKLSGSFACSGANLATNLADELRRRGAPDRAGRRCGRVDGRRRGRTPNRAHHTWREGPSHDVRLRASGGDVCRQAPGVDHLRRRGGRHHEQPRRGASGFQPPPAKDRPGRIWPATVGSVLVRQHPRFRSPWVATVALTLVAAVLCCIGSRALLVLLSGEVFTAGLVVALVLLGRRRGHTGVSSF